MVRHGVRQANRPPTASALSLSDATLAWKSSADYDVSDKFEDADGDTLTYSAASQYPGVITAAITGSGPTPCASPPSIRLRRPSRTPPATRTAGTSPAP